jgi:hypothetical protein
LLTEDEDDPDPDSDLDEIKRQQVPVKSTGFASATCRAILQ